ncbi:hypothetical protein ACFWNJ_22910, partial [Streptomyces sp. NPDC058398]
RKKEAEAKRKAEELARQQAAAREKAEQAAKEEAAKEGTGSGTGTGGTQYSKYDYPGTYQDHDFHGCRRDIDDRCPARGTGLPVLPAV